MGVDTKITFPPGTKVQDVAEVLGIIAGLPSERYPLATSGHHKDSIALRVHGVEVKTTSVPEMAWIVLEGKMVDGQIHHRGSYHFEWDEHRAAPGSTGMLVTSTPFWIAAGLRLVQFFGGTIDFNDCDDIAIDAGPYETVSRSAEDGQPWQDHQDAMANVEPLDPGYLAIAAKHAAYTADGRWR